MGIQFFVFKNARKIWKQDGFNNRPETPHPRCPHPSPWDLQVCQVTKGIKIADGGKVTDQMTLE